MFQIAKLRVVGIVVGYAAVAVFLSLAVGLWNPGWNPFSASTSKGTDIVVNAVSKAIEGSKSLQLNLLLEIEADAKMSALSTGDNQYKNIKIGLDLKNQIDKSNSKKIKTLSQINLGMQAEGVSMSGDLEMRDVGDSLYLKIVSLPPFLPLPASLEQLKGQWIKMSLGDLQKKLAASGLQMASADLGEYQAVLKGLKEIAKGKNFFEIKKRWGQEDMAGAKAERYTVALNKKAIKDFVPDYLDLAKKYVPEDQRAEAEKQALEIKSDFAKNFEQYWAAIGGLTFDIWVDKASGRMVRFVWEKEIDPAQLSKALQESEGVSQQEIKTMKIKVDFNLSRFNESFEIAEPTEFITAEKALGSLVQQFASSTLSGEGQQK